MARRKKDTGEALADPMYAAFVASALEDPTQVETVGRILADWLDDHDEPALAAWHRKPLAGIAPKGTKPYEADLKRVRAMLAGLPKPFLADLDLAPFDAATLRDGLAPGGTIPPLAGYAPARNSPHGIAVVRFGFVTDLVVPADVWAAHGRRVAQAHPIRSVVPLGLRFQSRARMMVPVGIPEAIVLASGNHGLAFPSTVEGGRQVSAAMLAFARGQTLDIDTGREGEWVVNVLAAGEGEYDGRRTTTIGEDALEAVARFVIDKGGEVTVTSKYGYMRQHALLSNVLRQATPWETDFVFPEAEASPMPPASLRLTGSGTGVELEHRRERLIRTYRLAHGWLRSTPSQGHLHPAVITGQLVGLDDHKGHLTASWAWPNDQVATEWSCSSRFLQGWQAFSWAWEVVGESHEATTHSVHAHGRPLSFGFKEQLADGSLRFHHLPRWAE